jgi:hypothetical protein
MINAGRKFTAYAGLLEHRVGGWRRVHAEAEGIKHGLVQSQAETPVNVVSPASNGASGTPYAPQLHAS